MTKELTKEARLAVMDTEHHELRSVSGLTKRFNEFVRQAYGFTPAIPVTINGRLKTAMGRYCYTANNQSLRIEIAGFLAKYGSEELIESVLRHEAVHYAMHTLGRPFDDGHPEFEAELVKHDAVSTGTVAFKYPRPVHYYECGCQTHTSGTKFQKPRICLSCRNRLKFKKTVTEVI